jgi:hypothetical protein
MLPVRTGTQIQPPGYMPKAEYTLFVLLFSRMPFFLLSSILHPRCVLAGRLTALVSGDGFVPLFPQRARLHRSQRTIPLK